MSVKKQRLCYAGAFLLLLMVEVLIALFVRDDFVRPYLGDVLAVIGVYCGGRILFPQRIRWLSAVVTGFALCVELLQLTDLSALSGEGSFLAILLGSTFDPHDILCYIAGGTATAVWDLLLLKKGQANDKL